MKRGFIFEKKTCLQRHFIYSAKLCRRLPVLAPSLYGCDPPLLFSAVGGTFTGLKNYETVFANQAFLLAGENTIRFFGTCIPLLVLLSLITAVLINGLNEMHRQLLKTAFLLSMAIPVASVVLLWRAL